MVMPEENNESFKRINSCHSIGCVHCEKHADSYNCDIQEYIYLRYIILNTVSGFILFHYCFKAIFLLLIFILIYMNVEHFDFENIILQFFFFIFLLYRFAFSIHSVLLLVINIIVDIYIYATVRKHVL